MKEEDNRSIETYRRAVQDRDGHTKNIGNDAYLSIKEAALLAGINPATLHKWIKKGKIEAVQSSKTVRIPRQAFENWLQSRKKDDRLKLALNLAFSCSLRMGEMLGLTWDCVDISEEAIAESRAFIYVDKEVQRVEL